MVNASVSRSIIENEIRSALTVIMLDTGGRANTVHGDTNLFSEGYLDSFGLLNLINELEDRLDTELDIGDFDEDRLMTINGLSEEILKQIQRN